MKQYIVDAFTRVPFSGNPAAVCVTEAWLPEKIMQALAMENNLSETAFIVKEKEGYRLRWFTPGSEVALCGHATLASSFVILNYFEPGADEVRFNTLSGELVVRKKGSRYEMNLPADDFEEIPVTDEMEAAFGIRPVRAFLGADLMCVFEKEEQVRSMRPDQALLAALPGRGQNVTARGRTVDCVSRSFFPKLAVPEDPVCGSAHCQIAVYWGRVLGQKTIEAYQASKRGGYLYCEILDGGRVAVSGEAAPVAVSEITADLGGTEGAEPKPA